MIQSWPRGGLRPLTDKKFKPGVDYEPRLASNQGIMINQALVTQWHLQGFEILLSEKNVELSDCPGVQVNRLIMHFFFNPTKGLC